MSNSGHNTPFSTLPVLEQLHSVIRLLPTPALIVDLNGHIRIGNQKAVQFFCGCQAVDSLQDVKINSRVVDLQYSHDLMTELMLKKEVVSRKILLRKFDKSIACVNLFACIIREEPEYILIQFTDISPKSHILLTEMVQSLHREIMLLKPYLNKPGKDVLENILKNNSLEGFCNCTTKQTNQHEVIRERRTASIHQLIPQLTRAELTFCGFLSLKMQVDEIALITGKTSNSLRVSFHRILKKSSHSNGKELLRRLESITE